MSACRGRGGGEGVKKVPRIQFLVLYFLLLDLLILYELFKLLHVDRKQAPVSVI